MIVQKVCRKFISKIIDIMLIKTIENALKNIDFLSAKALPEKTDKKGGVEITTA